MTVVNLSPVESSPPNKKADDLVGLARFPRRILMVSFFGPNLWYRKRPGLRSEPIQAFSDQAAPQPAGLIGRQIEVSLLSSPSRHRKLKLRI